LNKPYFLYIINNAGICLFSYNFKKHVEIFDVPLFSGFITAVSKFSEELNKQLSSVETSDRIPSIPINMSFEIMLAYKGSLTGALIVEKKDIDEDMKTYLDNILEDFLSIFKNVLSNWNDDVAVFEIYNEEIERIFNKMTIFSFQIPELKENYDKDILTEEFIELVESIDGKRDIRELAELLGRSIDEIISMISKLLWYEVIVLSQKVYDDDIFEAKRNLFYLIRAKEINYEYHNIDSAQNKEKDFELLKRIDGFKTVYELSEVMYGFKLHDIKRILSYYLSHGEYLEKIELYPQIIKISDDVRNDFPPEFIALSYSLENICDGDISLSDISKKIDVPIQKIKRVFDLLGNEVTFRKKSKK